MIYKIILNGILVAYIVKCYLYLVTILQQNHYDLKKLSYSLFTFYGKKKYQYYYYLGFIFSILSLFKVEFLIVSICLLLYSFVYTNQYIIKLKYTKRMIRLLVTSFVLIILLNYISFCFTPINYLISLILPLVLVVAYFLNLPFENRIKRYYQKKAIQKIAKMKNLTKIAITGSFGKTSTKDMLEKVLSTKYLTLKTPASYNTMMGLSKTINQNLTNETEIFIMEMGAFFVGEIKKMTQAFLPQICLITEIGMQHLSTFHTIENVIKAKFEIACSLDQKGCLILNYDNIYISKYDLSQIHTPHIYTYGITNGDYHIKNLIFEKKKMTFDIYYQDQFVIDITTYLLGRHNALNILATFTLLQALKQYHIEINNKTFQTVISKIEPTLHRLSYRKEGIYHIYDDSYSSNIIGFKNACEMLSMQQGKKIIITPGIVDAGKYTDSINEEFAKIMIDVFDEIYLIDNPSSKVIEKALKATNHNYFVFSSFKKAYFHILSQYNRSDEFIHILIENDLPDSFLER